MYIPSIYYEENKKDILAFMQQYPFAIVIGIENNFRPIASHLPLTINNVNDKLFLRGHFAKNNELALILHDTTECLVIFSEPHAYISPVNYDKELNVPTWNYISVHCYGKMMLINDIAESYDQLDEMINSFEPLYLQKWKTMPAEFKDKMIRGIIPFTIEVKELQASRKLSQNKTIEEQNKIAQSLLQSSITPIKVIGEEMLKNINSKING